MPQPSPQTLACNDPTPSLTSWQRPLLLPLLWAPTSYLPCPCTVLPALEFLPLPLPPPPYFLASSTLNTGSPCCST